MMRFAFLIISLLFPFGAFAAEAPAPQAGVEPPPGWTDITGKPPVKGVLLALRGPEGSSFAVALMPASAADNAASVKAYLMRVLDGLRAGAKLDYRSDGRVETKAFRNGVNAQLMRATVDGAPRLVVAVVDAGGPPLLATLSSAAPDAMMGPLFGALRLTAPAAVKSAGVALSADEQLQIALGGGLRSRELTPDERRRGAVLVIDGAGSEVVFLKVENDDAAPKDQAAIVRATAADEAKVAVDAVSPAKRADTPAGPSAVYAWAKIKDAPNQRFAAGFLPWQYWGYSILARGPQADELLAGSLAAVKQGPSAVDGLVRASPRIEIPEDGARRHVPAAAVAIAGALLVLIIWSLSRKNANVSS
ncbi:MAG TPA: hypothetical protein VN915_03670 [Elusimicrobiota bacterium]|nr:hypothetical protein [Elusimicrobiota bacterium]